LEQATDGERVEVEGTWTRAARHFRRPRSDRQRELLLDGALDAVIDQNPRVEAREALNVVSHRTRGLSYSFHRPRLQVIFRENIPETEGFPIPQD
jgi:hypothetical protein